MPNTDREMLIAVLAVVDGVAELEGSVTVEAAKDHIASTPDTGSDGAADWNDLLGDFEGMIGIARMYAEELKDKEFSETLRRRWRELREVAAPGRTARLEEIERLQGRTTTPTPSPPIPDSADELQISPNVSKDLELDTGGVEGPYDIESEIASVSRALGDGLEDSHLAAIRGALEAAYSEGHKAGFRARWKDIGTDEVLAEAHQRIEKAQTVRGGLPFISALTAREIINDLTAAHKAGASGSGEAVLAEVLTALKGFQKWFSVQSNTTPSSVVWARFQKTFHDLIGKLHTAVENPASGSDGLREAAKEVMADASEIAFGLYEVSGGAINSLAAALGDTDQTKESGE